MADLRAKSDETKREEDRRLYKEFRKKYYKYIEPDGEMLDNPTEQPPQPGGGGVVTGETPYKPTSPPMASRQRSPAVAHYKSGKPDSEMVEKNVKEIRFDNYQFACWVTMHDIEHDDYIQIKLGGTHMGNGWFDHGVSATKDIKPYFILTRTISRL